VWLGRSWPLSCRPRQVEFAARGVLQGEHDLEHRAVAEAARRVDGFDHLFEGNVLVGVGVERLGLDALEPGGEALCRVQLDSEGRAC